MVAFHNLAELMNETPDPREADTTVEFAEKSSGYHIVENRAAVHAAQQDASKVIAHISPGHGSASIKTSDGKSHTAPRPSAKPLTLSNWSVTVEHWDPPKDLYDIETVAVQHNTTHHFDKLVSWQSIDELKNGSGRGYYKTTFNWKRSKDVSGAVMYFGPIVHTIRASINGHTLPPLDVTWARADILNYLKDGENVVEAVVTTNLVNVLKTIWDKLETSGVYASAGLLSGPAASPPPQDYGL